MKSLLNLDQSTLANMTAALEFVCRKLPPDRDNPAIRKYIAQEIVAATDKTPTSLSNLISAGLNVVNSFLFPPARSWLRALRG
jgi:hypothetical protein